MKKITFYIILVVIVKYIRARMIIVGIVEAVVGIGVIFGAYMLTAARNPEIEERMLRFLFLGFALTEAMGLLAIMMAFLILYS
jgi:F0F1-type ATP synthase membrane subunit c/vacuolar-type H+-ATPase subunit K